jgi:transposase
MSDSTLPPGIDPADWAATPPAVRTLVGVLLAQVQALQARVTDLEAHRQQHSGNSSRPPSSDPPSAPPRPPRPRTGRQRGGQPGHPGQHRELLPPDQVDELVLHPPTACPHCQTALSPDLPATGSVWRHQVWDVPPVQPHVTEHQFPTIICPQCQLAVRAPRPPDVPLGAFGPRVAALVGVLHGRYRLSARETTALLADLCGLPLSLGSVPALCQAVSAALEPVSDVVARTVQAQAVTNVDETSWKEAGKRRWLWVAVTAVCTRFQVTPQRSGAALQALLGTTFTGIVGSDRYCAYNSLPVAQRQICWAHLKRNWQAFRERDGPVGAWGEEAMVLIERLFSVWHRFRAGQLDRSDLQREMAPIQAEVRTLVERGRDALPWEKARSFCRDVLWWWPALWTFVDVAGVEPTNNAAERALRPAVLWRKGSFGTQSASGNAFVAHILTVTATCRQQQRHVLTFLTEAVRAHWIGLPAPALIITS